MKPAFLTLEVVVHAEPPAATDAIKSALSKAHALITGATRFSNKALAFQLELLAKHLPALTRELCAVAQIGASETEKVATLARAVEPDREVLGSLHVTLVHHAPDERVELPKVPG